MRRDILERVTLDLLSIPHHFEIMTLLREEGPLHVAEIGEKLQIAKAQMTQLTGKLADMSLVERKPDTADRRTINIAITGKGKSILEAHNSLVKNAVRETMSCLTDEELEDLSDSLRRMRDILSKLR